MYILGLYTGHTATAALLKDGVIIAVASEERFVNVKNYLGFPKQASLWCLEYAGITGADLDRVVLCNLYSAPIHTTDQSGAISVLTPLYRAISSVRSGFRRLSFYLPFIKPVNRLVYRTFTKLISRITVNKEKSFTAKHLNVAKDKIVNYEHHLLHAATAYYASPFNTEKALVLTLDAEGDWLCSTVNIFEGLTHKRVAATPREHSLGWLFLYVTQYLGMKPMEHEYKVMGLAPYAKEQHVDKLYQKIKNIITLDKKNPLRFTSRLSTQDSLWYLKKILWGYRFDNIAGAFQKLLEQRMLEWVKSAIKETGVSTVIFSGGAFMNVKANMLIAALPEIKKSFFMPSAGDESIPIGACYLGYIDLMAEKGETAKLQPLTDLYLGDQYSDKEIGKYVKSKGLEKKYIVKHYADIETEVANLLASNQVVARFAGRMEWGARSLGNRAILANPKNPDVVMVINEQMKDRDFWMPFAPSVLEERINDYCQNPRNLYVPYMIVGMESTDLGRSELKAAMHPYDFTIRPQAVRAGWNPRYHTLIKAFEKQTGIGGILNTSFNLHGFPIVRQPKDALYAFEHSGLRHLAIENYLISKK
jgi:carbamoyltransferase